MAKRVVPTLLVVLGLCACAILGIAEAYARWTQPTATLVTIESEPSGAQVLIDGKQISAVTPTRYPLGAASEHRIQLRTQDRMAELTAHCANLGFKGNWLAFVMDVEPIAGEVTLDGSLGEQVIAARLQPK
jgi:hypothetical protein